MSTLDKWSEAPGWKTRRTRSPRLNRRSSRLNIVLKMFLAAALSTSWCWFHCVNLSWNHVLILVFRKYGLLKAPCPLHSEVPLVCESWKEDYFNVGINRMFGRLCILKMWCILRNCLVRFMVVRSCECAYCLEIKTNWIWKEIHYCKLYSTQL